MLSSVNSLVRRAGWLVAALVILLQGGLAQNAPATHEVFPGPDSSTESTDKVAPPAADTAGQKSPQKQDSSALVLGPGDEIEISVYGAPDLSGRTRVSAEGNISMPLVGYIRVVGLTSSEAEGTIESRLRENKIVNDPQVSVYVKEYTSANISVTGEVARPGPYSALGPHRLFDILQAAGGPTEKASNRVVISHRGSDKPVTVEIPKDPNQLAQINVEILPGDTLVVPPAPIVYVLGEVNKPGGYILNSINGVTLLRIVTVAGGPTHDASVGSTRILRTTPDGLKEQPVPLKEILRAKAPDIPVQSQDIIYIPRSRLKAALNPGMLLNTMATVALYRVPY